MPLKENFRRLINLGLDQAEFFLKRRLFITNEALAKEKQRLKFLQRCSNFNVFLHHHINNHAYTPERNALSFWKFYFNNKTIVF